MSLALQERVSAAVAPETVVHHLRGVLSPRELEVAQLALAGLPTTEVARRLFVTVNTVKTHIRHILRKTGAHSRADLLHRVLEAEAQGRPLQAAAEPRGPAEWHAGSEPLDAPEPPAVPERLLPARDAVTGLLTRGAFRQRAAEVMASLPAPGLSVVWLEVEGRLFLPAPDRVAADLAVAQALAETVRTPDLAFRWSDTQFLALLPGTDREIARAVTMRLALALGQWASASGCDLLFSLASASSAEGIASPDGLVAAAKQRIGLALKDIA